MTPLWPFNTTIRHMGVSLPLDAEIITPNIRKALKSGRYEHQEARCMLKLIEAGERVMEIGGGIGFLSTLAARHPATEAVLVFEANPRLMEHIRATHQRNGIEGVEVRNHLLAVRPRASAAAFYLRQNFWASSTLEGPWRYKKKIEVPLSDFDTVISEFKPTLLVCDIEGGEVELFEEARLDGVRAVLLEVHQKVIGGRGMKRVFDALSVAGFFYDQYHSAGAVVVFRRLGQASS